MQAIKRAEIILPTAALDKLIKIMEEQNVSGFTIVENVKGKGNRGYMDGDGLHNAFQNSMVILGCSEEELENLIEPLREILTENGGVCMVSDALWLIH